MIRIYFTFYGRYDPLVGTAGFNPVEGVSADSLGRFDSYTFSPSHHFDRFLLFLDAFADDGRIFISHID